MEKKNYELPPLSLLGGNKLDNYAVSDEEIADNKEKLLSLFRSYGIDVNNIEVSNGPSVSAYSIALKKRIKKSDYEKISKEVLMSYGYRIQKTDDGCLIEIPNRTPTIVSLKSVLESNVFRSCNAELPVALGVNTSGTVKVADLTQMPHLLIGGATGQGKTDFLNAMVMSLLYSKKPSEMKFVIIDPEKVLFRDYSRLPRTWFAMPDSQNDTSDKMPVLTDIAEVGNVLNSLCIEMDKRYGQLADSNVSDIKAYNEKAAGQILPYIVVVIDEYFDLIVLDSDGDIKKSIISLAEKGKAVGIHVVMATSRPSANVISSLVKTNFPTRIAFRVATVTDSRTILDQQDAVLLNGKGDMLYYDGGELERIQCPLVFGEIEQTVDYICEQMK